MGFCLHLRLLMWKNFTIRRRQKIRCVIDIVWPLTLFIMLVALRFVGNKENVHECHFEPRAMPSAGMLAFLRGALCTLNNTCHTHSNLASEGDDAGGGSRALLLRMLRRAQLLADAGEVPRLWDELRDAGAELAALADDLRTLPYKHEPSPHQPPAPPYAPIPPPPVDNLVPPPPFSSSYILPAPPPAQSPLLSPVTPTLEPLQQPRRSAQSSSRGGPASVLPSATSPSGILSSKSSPSSMEDSPRRHRGGPLPGSQGDGEDDDSEQPERNILSLPGFGPSALDELFSKIRDADPLDNEALDIAEDNELNEIFPSATNESDVGENEDDNVVDVDESVDTVRATGRGKAWHLARSRWEALGRHVADAARLLRSQRQRVGLNKLLSQLVAQQSRAAERVKERLRVSDGVAQLLAAQRLVCGAEEGGDGDNDLPPLARLALLADINAKEDVPPDFVPDPDCTDACNRHFHTLEMNAATRLLWHWLKPFVRGRILYAPATNRTRRVMAHVDAFFNAFHRLQQFANRWATHVLPKAQRRFDKLTASMKELDAEASQNVLNATKEGQDLRESLKWLHLLRDSYSDATQWLTMLQEVLDCFLAHKTQPFPTEEEAVVEGLRLLRHGRLWAVVAFETDAAPPFIAYKIRVNSRNMDDTNFIRSILHYPGPRSHPFFDLKYFTSGFLYIQDLVERGIITEVLKEEYRAAREAALEANATANATSPEPSTYPDVVSENLDTLPFPVVTLSTSPSSTLPTPVDAAPAAPADDFCNCSDDSWPVPGDMLPGYVMQQFPYPCHIYDKFSFAVSRTFPLLMVLSWVYGCASLVKAAVAEKEQRLAEAQRAVGVADGALWLAWLLEGFLTGAISAAFLTGLLVMGRVLERSSMSLVFALLLTYCLAAAAFACLLATFFSRASVAAGVGGMVFVLSYLPYATLDLWSSQAPNALKYSAGVLCNVAFGFGCLYLSAFEQQGVGATWELAARSPFDGDSYSLLACMATLIADSVLYMLLAWYISNVWPGRYGVPKPLHFPLTRSFWKGVDEHAITRLEETAEESLDDVEAAKVKSDKEGTSRAAASVGAAGTSAGGGRTGGGNEVSGEGETLWGSVPVLEAPPANLLPGIRLRKLTKVFPGGRVAVDHLSLAFYEGHITAFLGHNGAGKTTVISMLTGLLPPTSGTAFIRGLDIRRHMLDIRRSLGVCPQHNVLYDNLTAAEHLWLAARLRGQTAQKLKQEVPAMLRELGLSAKAKTLAGRLSGGARRKLCVATAFVGNCRTVILDEPTAGVDPASRRSIWRLLERARRQGRTLLLCTHHLDEAERLGDRVAVLARGRLLCAGSPLFLRRRLGLGYRLTLEVAPSTSPPDAPPARAPSDHAAEAATIGSRGAARRDIATETNPEHKSQLLSAAQVDWLESLVRSHAGAGAYVLQRRGTELLLALPAAARARFPALFADLLEAQRAGALRSFGVRDSSLEEIFLRLPQGVQGEEVNTDIVPQRGDIESMGYPETNARRETWMEHTLRILCCAGVTKKKVVENEEESVPQDIKTSEIYLLTMDQEAARGGPHIERPASKRVSGCAPSLRLALRQLRALLTKRVHHTRRSLRVLFSELVVPPLFVTATLAMTQLLPRPGPAPPLVLVPWLYDAPRQTFFERVLPLPQIMASHATTPPSTFPTYSTDTYEKMNREWAAVASAAAQLPAELWATPSAPIQSPAESDYGVREPRMVSAVERRMQNYEEALLGVPGMGTRCVLGPVGGRRELGCTPRRVGPLTYPPPPSEPLPRCSCKSGAQECAPGAAGPPPPHAYVSTGDILLNLTGRNVHQWLVRTTNLQEERTYGGFSFRSRTPLDAVDWNLGEALRIALSTGAGCAEPCPVPYIAPAPDPAPSPTPVANTASFPALLTAVPPPLGDKQPLHDDSKPAPAYSTSATSSLLVNNASNKINFIRVWFNNKGWATSGAYLNAANNVVLRVLIREVRSAAARGAPIASEEAPVLESPEDEEDDWEERVMEGLPDTAAYGIRAINHPMNNTDEQLRDPQHFILLSNINVVHALAVLLAMSFVPASFLVLLVEERASRAKHLQLLCGAGRVVYWVAELIWGLSCYVLAASLCLLVFVAFAEEAYVSEHTLPLFLALLMLYGWASVPMMFPASFVFREPSTAFVLMACLNLAIGMLTSITVVLLQIFAAETLAPLQEQLRSAFLVFPQFCLCQGLVDLVTAHYVAHARAAIVGGSTTPAVEANLSRNLWYLAGDGVAFFLLTLAIELWPRSLRPRRIRRGFAHEVMWSEAKGSLDADVASERARVHVLSAEEARGHALLLKDLSKEYPGGPLALDALCLGVHPGEVFGLLGLNGAGKTTTFKLLTGEARATRGDALVAGASVMRQRAQALRRCGYCPQADALHAQLSVREHLRLYAVLRGLPPRDAQQAVRESLARLQLWRCKDQPAGTLSGGTRRKLSSALALLGEPPVLLMDEPTAGMDAGARAALRGCVRAAAARGAGVMLTSHVLAECEALCARLSVLASGRLRCLGSAQHLKSRFGRGYLVELRAPEGAGSALAALAAQLPGASPITSRSSAAAGAPGVVGGPGPAGVSPWCGRAGSTRSSGSSPRYGSGGSAGARVRERVSAHARLELPHAGARHLAALFSALEAARAAGALHDYSVSQATLEEVFLRFAYEAAGEELADSPDAAPAPEDSDEEDEDEVEVLIMSEERDGEYEF